MPKDLSRRKFLQHSAGSAAIAAANSVFLGDSRLEAISYLEAAPSDRLRFGIIGVGMQGSDLLKNSIELPGVECVAACDLYDGRHRLAREIAGAGVPTTRRYQELLNNKEIDCIIAAVPDHWHKKIVVDTVLAGKDIYCEKPMSHSAADGVEMVKTARSSGRIVQIGSQGVSSVLYAKAKELLEKNIIGELMMVEVAQGRNSPDGAWQYPLPPDISPQTVDWDTWQGEVAKRSFDPKIFARWRCWKEYGTGVAGDLMVHLISGMLFMLGLNEAPKRTLATGGILRWKDGRNMPDVHAALFDYDSHAVYVRLNLGTETHDGYRFLGSKGILEVTGHTINYLPQSGRDDSPSYYAQSFPKELREEYVKKWHEENDVSPGKEPVSEGFSYTSVSSGELKPHLWNFFHSVRTRQPVVEDVVFGHHAALACHMANESYFQRSAVVWDAAAQKIKTS
ncbi:MAG: gfo/Idh/MocA family oxidoreductase [Acidobacteria bacterium]|nr:MAG: gfo/Idh/MocA family oxidoreductase [Acidobacteriota bacterium]PYU41531.1 MAG: gfo/Idh/MocA family oxidoreductase [Acidobacteriota bacterium]PYU73083.1 MAG: gfo/Idh/MocA family oxidoreductase [Acidobacteriota bacterium]